MFADKIRSILKANGWTFCGIQNDEEKYVKDFDDITMLVEIELTPESLGAYGYYGIGCLHIMRFNHEPPYMKHDIKVMLDAFSEAETDLLKMNVPFRANYVFQSYNEHHLCMNLDLRKKYDLYNLEKEHMV